MNILVWNGKAWATQRVDARAFGLQLFPAGRRDKRRPPRAPLMRSKVAAMALGHGGAGASNGRGETFARPRPLTPRPVSAAM